MEQVRTQTDTGDSARILSLSGVAGIWVGLVALAGIAVAYRWDREPQYRYVGKINEASTQYFDAYAMHFIVLGLAVLIAAIGGNMWITHSRNHGWPQVRNGASGRMIRQLIFPLFAGGVFSMIFIYYGVGMFVAPACLAFYGVALISASRHFSSLTRYLGMLEVMLGCTNLFFPEYGILFWGFGFGLLHIVYGAIKRAP